MESQKNKTRDESYLRTIKAQLASIIHTLKTKDASIKEKKRNLYQFIEYGMNLFIVQMSQVIQ